MAGWWRELLSGEDFDCQRMVQRGRERSPVSMGVADGPPDRIGQRKEAVRKEESGWKVLSEEAVRALTKDSRYIVARGYTQHHRYCIQTRGA